MNFLLYSGKTSATGRILAEVLGFRSGSGNPKNPVEHLIRWGSTERVERRPSGKVLNKLSAVRTATDKYGVLAVLQAEGVPVPRTIALTEGLKEKIAFPALARKRVHQQGKDIFLCLQKDDLVTAFAEGAEYAIEYVPTNREYRIHVFKGTIIKVSEKVLTYPEKKVTKWIRNLENGYTFRKPEHKVGTAIKNTAIAAVEACNLDFGAVDLIVADTGIPFVLEINTGPRLIASSMKKYATAICQALELPTDTLNTAAMDQIEEDENEDNEE